jgi:hypothetical protein
MAAADLCWASGAHDARKSIRRGGASVRVNLPAPGGFHRALEGPEPVEELTDGASLALGAQPGSYAP